MEKVNVDIKEVYRLLCPECRERLKQLVKDKMTDQMVTGALEGKQE